jgi:alkylation response protein AidB-like acyl-CoA dehydrogenase
VSAQRGTASGDDANVGSNIDVEEFRNRVRAWLDSEAPPARGGEAAPPLDREHERADVVRARRLQRSLFDAGLAGITWPVEYGGLGLSAQHDQVFRDETLRYDLGQTYFMIAIGTMGPTILQVGTEEQKWALLPPILRGETTWCQLFSEPNAGSDVASLQTRAVRDGDRWIVSGQKVWTSGAHRADRGALLARTDPSVPKHQGLSMLLVDMHAPGVEVRPLRQATGESHFNEVFFTDVEIPIDQVLGEVNGGWRTTTSMLMNERVAIGSMRTTSREGGHFTAALAAARAVGATGDPVVRQELAELYTRQRLLTFIAERVQAALRSGQVPGPEGSVAKLANSDLARRGPEVAARLLGAASVAWSPDQADGERWSRAVMSRFVLSVGGGTSEIQRNIMGERVLGLPPEPSVDRGVPFSELLVGTQRARRS